VHDLLAHLVGVAADVAAGRREGAPGPEWTARQVAERRDRPVPDLVEEWQRASAVIEPGLMEAPTGPNPVLDIVCHEGDLCEALGRPRPPRNGWLPVLEILVGWLGRRLKQPGTLVIRDETGAEWTFGSGAPDTTLRVDGYELLRGMYSRRSQRQIAGWDWTPAPAERLHRFGAFGPRDDDQPVPARS
jgi:uncharacterized protein (TIGR03083 family)